MFPQQFFISPQIKESRCFTGFFLLAYSEERVLFDSHQVNVQKKTDALQFQYWNFSNMKVLNEAEVKFQTCMIFINIVTFFRRIKMLETMYDKTKFFLLEYFLLHIIMKHQNNCITPRIVTSVNLGSVVDITIVDITAKYIG